MEMMMLAVDYAGDFADLDACGFGDEDDDEDGNNGLQASNEPAAKRAQHHKP
jgi:hypothetical protein